MALKKELVAAGLFGNAASAVGGSVVTGIVADTGSAQAGATLLTGAINVLGTVGTAGDSVLLPFAEKGDLIIVRNNTATSADVFPQLGGTINGGSANAAVAVGATTGTLFVCIGGLDWITA